MSLLSSRVGAGRRPRTGRTERLPSFASSAKEAAPQAPAPQETHLTPPAAQYGTHSCSHRSSAADAAAHRSAHAAIVCSKPVTKGQAQQIETVWEQVDLLYKLGGWRTGAGATWLYAASKRRSSSKGLLALSLVPSSIFSAVSAADFRTKLTV